MWRMPTTLGKQLETEGRKGPIVSGEAKQVRKSNYLSFHIHLTSDFFAASKCAATNAKNALCGNPAQAGSLACWIQNHQDQVAKLVLPAKEDLKQDGPIPSITDSDGVQG